MVKKSFIIIILLTLMFFIYGCHGNEARKNGEPDPPIVQLPDSEILDKDFSATYWNGNYASGRVTFHVNYEAFLGDNTVYNNDIALFGTALCNDLADKWTTKLDGVSYLNRLNKTIIYNEVGFLDPEIIDLNKNTYEQDLKDTSRFALAHYPIVKDNTKYEIVVVNVCMTVGAAEWESNLDVGSSTSGYSSYYGDSHPDWKNKLNHKGFDVTANRITPYVDNYLASLDNEANKILFFIGYSRGAAIANILAANYTNNPKYKVFGYTYETPTTVCTTSDTESNYKNIFNICTTRDIISMVPLSSWGFKRYGVDMIMEVNPTTYKTITGATFAQTDDDAFPHKTLLESTREEIYDKEIVLYEVLTDTQGVKATTTSNYNEYTKLINKLGNPDMFKISELECVDTDNQLYNFTIKGSLSCFMEVLTYFLPSIEDMKATQTMELLNYMSMLNYYMPVFEDLMSIVGLGFDKIKIVNPHYLLATVSVITDYNK